MKRLLEIIATSVEDAVAAECGGADRIELVTALSEGGLTPSYGLIERTVKAVRIPVRVMVRPHSNSFVYTVDEVETMMADIAAIRRIGAAGIVLGALTPEGRIDHAALAKLYAAAEPGLPATFHRAIDEAVDPLAALRELEAVDSVDRVLTSGGGDIGAFAARQQLRAWQSTTRLPLIAAKGLTPELLPQFLQESPEITEIHMGTGVRVDGRMDKPVDASIVAACVKIAASSQ